MQNILALFYDTNRKKYKKDTKCKKIKPAIICRHL